MNSLDQAFSDALMMVLTVDPSLYEIVGLSLTVSLSAAIIACLIGFPLASLIVVYAFPGSRWITMLLSALMGLPPVVAGLLLYLLLSRSGPLGSLGLLFTPTAMIIAQTLLCLPIAATIARQTLASYQQDYQDLFRAMNVPRHHQMKTIVMDAGIPLLTAFLAAFGRAIAEVGAVIIVGGNINHATRVMTTSIALETSKGNLGFALGLGAILLAIVILINWLAHMLSTGLNRDDGAVRA